MSNSSLEKSQVSRAVTTVSAVCLMALFAQAATAAPTPGDREKARQIYDRIAGVPPSDATLDIMEPLMASDAAGAAA